MPEEVIRALSIAAFLSLMLCLGRSAWSWPLVSGAALLPFLVCLWWIHPQADDWSYGASSLNNGWLSAQLQWYQNWSGRFSASAAISSWTIAGPQPGIYRLVAWLIPFSATGVAWWASYQCGLRSNHLRAVLTMSMLAVFTLLLSHPAAAWYWLAGSASYGLGSILALTSILLISPTQQPRWRTALACIAAFAAMGCSETVAFIFGGGLLALLIAWPQRRGALVWVIGAAILAFSLVAGAPGNDNRIAAIRTGGSSGLPLFSALGQGSLSALTFFVSIAIHPIVLTCTLAFWPFLVGIARWWQSRPRWQAPTTLILLVGSTAAVCSASFYTLGLGPPGRAGNVMVLGILIALFWVVPGCLPIHVRWWRQAWLSARYRMARETWLVVTLTCLWALYRILDPRSFDGESGTLTTGVIIIISLIVAVVLRRSPPSRGMTAALLASICIAGSPTWQRAMVDAIHLGPAYHQQLNERYQLIRAAHANGQQTVTVPALNLVRPPSTFVFIDLTWDGTDWVNTSCAQCFGLREIWLDPSSLQPATD